MLAGRGAASWEEAGGAHSLEAMKSYTQRNRRTLVAMRRPEAQQRLSPNRQQRTASLRFYPEGASRSNVHAVIGVEGEDQGTRREGGNERAPGKAPSTHPGGRGHNPVLVCARVKKRGCE